MSAGNAFVIERHAQQTSDHAASGVGRVGITVQPFDDGATYASPGSRRSDVPRSSATGKILSTDVDRSRAGFGVIVAISTISLF